MPSYSFICKNAGNQRVEGTLSAFNEEAARATLKEMQLEVENLTEMSEVQKTPSASMAKIPEGSTAPFIDALSPNPPLAPSIPSIPDKSKTSSWLMIDDPAPFVHASSLRVSSSPMLDRPKGKVSYAPVLDTFRLYAGWLCAWYVAIFALGSLSYLDRLPSRIDLLEDLIVSPTIINFCFGAFLFLLLTSLYKKLHANIPTGMIFGIAWLSTLLIFRLNT